MKLRNALKEGYRKRKLINFALDVLPYVVCLFALGAVSWVKTLNLSAGTHLFLMLAIGCLAAILLVIILPLIFTRVNRKSSE